MENLQYYKEEQHNKLLSAIYDSYTFYNEEEEKTFNNVRTKEKNLVYFTKPVDNKLLTDVYDQKFSYMCPKNEKIFNNKDQLDWDWSFEYNDTTNTLDERYTFKGVVWKEKVTNKSIHEIRNILNSNKWKTIGISIIVSANQNIQDKLDTMLIVIPTMIESSKAQRLNAAINNFKQTVAAMNIRSKNVSELDMITYINQNINNILNSLEGEGEVLFKKIYPNINTDFEEIKSKAINLDIDPIFALKIPELKYSRAVSTQKGGIFAPPWERKEEGDNI